MLQQLLIDVTGAPFEELMARLVLEPVGMTDSSYDQAFPHAHQARVARGHAGGTPVIGGWHVQPEMAGAGLWSTPLDLVRLELEISRATLGDSVLLSPELAAQMVAPQVLAASAWAPRCVTGVSGTPDRTPATAASHSLGRRQEARSR